MKFIKVFVVVLVLLVALVVKVLGDDSDRYEEENKETVSDIYLNIKNKNYQSLANRFPYDEAQKLQISDGYEKLLSKFGDYKSHEITSAISGTKVGANGISFPVFIETKVTYENAITIEKFNFAGDILLKHNIGEQVVN